MDYGVYVSNVLVGTLMPIGIMMFDTIPGLRKNTDDGRMHASGMVTTYGHLLGVDRGDLFDYVLLSSVFAALMISSWVPRLHFQLTAAILMIWLSAYFGVVGVYMWISEFPPGPALFAVLVPLLVCNAVWRVVDLRSTFSGKVSDSQLVGWAIACFVFVFLGLSGIMLYRSPLLIRTAELERDMEIYFASAGNGSWLVGAQEPAGFVADRELVDAAAEEQAGLLLVPWWSAVGVLWAMFAAIAAMSPAQPKADLKTVKLLEAPLRTSVRRQSVPGGP